MDPNETMVEENFDTEATDDALLDDGIEEADESESLESLDSDAGEQDQPEEEKTQKATGGTTEPGWIKKRVGEAVDKALARQRSDLIAEMEAKYAPIRDRLLEMDAKELVRQGEFKTLERAKEYLQLKQGLPVSSQEEAPATQPRNPNGQFAPKSDPATTARIDMLKHQADRIKASGGPDVISEFQNNQEIKQKVINGEMDFYDVADQMKQTAKRRPPSPMRSPNGASGQNNPNAIDQMSDEQFKRLEKRISEGARYKLS